MASSADNSETAPLLKEEQPAPEYSSFGDRNNEKTGVQADSIQEVNGDDKAEFKFSSLSVRSKLTLLLCALANLFSNAGFALPAPFYPQEADKKGVSSTMVGIIFAVFQFVIFIASPILGNYLTRIGAKFMFVSGIFVGGSCSILFGFLNQCPPGTSFVVTSLLCRSVEALGLAAFITASFAIVSNEFPRHVSTVFGILETFSGVGLMIGPLIGGALYTVGGFGLPFFVVGAAVIVNGFLIYMTLPLPSDTKTQRKGSIMKLILSPLALIIILNCTVAATGISFLDPTLSNHLEHFNLSTLYIGLVFVIAPGLYAVAAPFWGYLTDAKNILSPLIIFGNLVCGIGYFLTGPSEWLPFLPFELYMVILGTVLIGISFGCIVVPTMKFLIIGAFEVGFEDSLDTYGIVSGLFNTSFCFGAFLGPILGGALIDKIGFRTGISIMGVLHLFTMIVSATYLTIRHRRKVSEAKNASSLESHNANTQVA